MHTMLTCAAVDGERRRWRGGREAAAAGRRFRLGGGGGRPAADGVGRRKEEGLGKGFLRALMC